jgi:dTDP-4-dehydrorhamnose 3,5-epimerase
MKLVPLKIPEVCLIGLPKFEDERGFFSEVFNKQSFASSAIHFNWVQDNHAMSAEAHTLRGLHFQQPPHSQAKLVRVSKGAIFDVAVDIRTDSPFFGQWVGAVLSEKLWNAILIPKGFAHGYLTLADRSEVQYKVDDYHAPECEGGIIWNDPDIAIEWPLQGQIPHLSAKDQTWTRFKETTSLFSMENSR